MPTAAAVAASTAAASTFASATSTIKASRHAFKPTPLLVPSVVAAAAAYRYKNVIVDRCSKLLERHKISSSSTVVCESDLPILPKLSISTSSYGPHQHLHASSSKVFGNADCLSYRSPGISRQKACLKPPRALKDDFFSFYVPVSTEKPAWWWRTLACVPYLIALQMSDVGYYLQPFLDHYDILGDLVYFVPGAITKFPAWFTIVYLYVAYLWIVKNKEWPHFFRYHLMMGMLLETAVQLVWYTSNFFPLIHYNGRFGIYYWAGVGFAYLLVMLQCVRCALAGGYAHIPFVSEAANIHTQYNIGGFQRPF